MVEPPGERAAAVYAALIGDTLAEERAQKDTIHQRATGVITTAGALVSLLFDLAAVVTASEDFTVPRLVDVTDKGAPVPLARESYPNDGFSHQG